MLPASTEGRLKYNTQYRLFRYQAGKDLTEMPTRQEVLRMKLEGLRLLVQEQLGLNDWPGDWAAAGSILEISYFNFQRSSTGAQLFGITLFGERVNGTGIDENPLVCIFRAYLLMKLDEAELGGH